MHKLLILLTTILALHGYSFAYVATKDYMSTNLNLPALDNTAIAQKYNRENTTSLIDLQNAAIDDLIKNVQVEQKKARAVGFEWTTIGDLIKSAKKEQKSGNYSSAINKLNTAKEHAILAQQQAVEQKEAGPRF